MVKNLPAMQETWVWSLGQEDPLEKGMEPHSSILAWWILWTEEPGGLQSMGLQREGQDSTTTKYTHPSTLSHWVLMRPFLRSPGNWVSPTTGLTSIFVITLDLDLGWSYCPHLYIRVCNLMSMGWHQREVCETGMRLCVHIHICMDSYAHSVV